MKVAAVVEKALTARRPRARYIVGVGPKLQVALMTNIPVRVRDRISADPACRAGGRDGWLRQTQRIGARWLLRLEAAGLQWLAAAGGAPCARVLAHDATSLTLERLVTATPTPGGGAGVRGGAGGDT